MSPQVTLFVGWQDPKTRLWYVVAQLVRVIAADGIHEYRFRYVHGALDAQTRGFQPFVAFPDLNETVRSQTLLPFFGNRVMPSSRPDYATYLDQLGLQAPVEALTILARSGGRRTTERAEIEVFAPPTARGDGTYETHFFVRGLRYFGAKNEALARLQKDDELLCMLDVQNPVNPEAVLLRTKEQLVLGYVPDYLCHDVSHLLKTGMSVNATIAKVNDPSVPIQVRVLCRMHLAPPPEYRFLSGSNFEPVEGNLSRAA